MYLNVYTIITVRKKVNRPSSKAERSTWEIEGPLDLDSAKLLGTGTEKDVALTVNIQGLAPVYRTVHSAFPA